MTTWDGLKSEFLGTVHLDHNGASLWQYLLSAEQAALENAPASAGPKYNDPLIGVRVLGFLLQDLWQHQSHSFGLIPYHRLCVEIASCLSPHRVIVGSKGEAQAQNAKIYELGLLYRNHLMRVFRLDGGPLPADSDHPSRPFFAGVRQRIIQNMKMPTTTPTARKHALLRDGYRCVVTGAFDYESCKLHPELRARATATKAARTPLDCAHIFSESAQRGDHKLDYGRGASAMAILTMFGFTNSAENLVGGNVEKHFNILTMAENLHRLFDRMEFWFEEVIGEANTYKICAADPDFFDVLGAPPQRVTFTVDPDVVTACEAQGRPVPALPSPSVLAIRAACSRVAHMAGAAEHADRILRDLEHISVMAEDGTTAELFASRLLQSMPTVRVGA
ncbi:hypothetical protein B0H15DRAFT_923519 [Mycena belliarum]|uniref:HNH nuclease domain-containing protein n=1 Tax=Mycena belliarum TaxID=1033014 RepID=A0AAD6U4U8_9AGAR|nr:hypothetical protein B0H15DRAFT_923519 [Mycena belliae]